MSIWYLGIHTSDLSCVSAEPWDLISSALTDQEIPVRNFAPGQSYGRSWNRKHFKYIICVICKQKNYHDLLTLITRLVLQETKMVAYNQLQSKHSRLSLQDHLEGGGEIWKCSCRIHVRTVPCLAVAWGLQFPFLLVLSVHYTVQAIKTRHVNEWNCNLK